MTRRKPPLPAATPTDFYVPICNLNLHPGDTIEVFGRGTFLLSSFNAGSWLARPIVAGKRGEPEYLAPDVDARIVGAR